MTRGELNPGVIKTFITAGNAIITVESKSTGKWYTYKIRRNQGKVMQGIGNIVGAAMLISSGVIVSEEEKPKRVKKGSAKTRKRRKQRNKS